MIKPEWGKKRTCTKCSTKFYDLCQKAIICPKCGAEYVAEEEHKKRRSSGESKRAKKNVIEVLEDIEVVSDDLGIEDDLDVDTELGDDLALPEDDFVEAEDR